MLLDLYLYGCGIIFLILLLKRVYSCSRASHNVPWARPDRKAPDPDLFPQYIQNKQGLWLYWHGWTALPSTTPLRGAVFIVSGLGEHTVRYQMLSSRFNNAGLMTFSLDHQGHGASEGDRAHVERFQDYIDDYILFVKRVIDQHPQLQQLPKFILGHSMGGLIAVNVRMQSERNGIDWTGTILSAPALRADPKVATPIKKFLAGVLANLLPKLALDPLDSHFVSQSKQVAEFYCTDPLVYHGGIRARWGNEVLKAMAQVAIDSENVTWPFLLLHGGDDRITALQGSLDFFERSQSSDKVLKVYQGMFHEIFNEPDRDRVIQDVLDNINNKIAPPSSRR